MRTFILISIGALCLLSAGCGDSITYQDPCHAEQLDNGDVKITCPDREDSVIPSGIDSSAQSCSIHSENDNTSTVTCGDSTVTVGYDCKDGYPGDITIGDGSSGLFLLQYTGCTSIQGSLYVYGDVNIGDSDAQVPITPWPEVLSTITSIGGSLRVSDAGYDHLAFSNLTSIGGTLDVSYTPNLTSLDGLSALKSVGGDLFIDSNDALTSLKGLKNIEGFSGGLDIYGNPLLTSLQGLPAQTVVHGDVWIGDNKALDNYDGFPAIQTIDGDLILTDLNISTLDGLGDLETVGNTLHIANNGTLNSIDALQNLTEIGSYYIANNPMLPECEIGWFLENVTVNNEDQSSSSNNLTCN